MSDIIGMLDERVRGVDIKLERNLDVRHLLERSIGDDFAITGKDFYCPYS